MTTPKPAPPDKPLDKLKAQLAQLDALVAEGVLSAQSAQASRAALEKQILRLVIDPPSEGAAAAPPEAAVRAPRRLVWGVAGFVLLFGLAGYGVMGNRDGWKVGPGERGEAPAAAGHSDQQGQILAMVAKLEERLKDKPDDVEGWQMVARSYSVMGRHAEALKAYQRLAQLKPQDAQVLADLADATAMAGGLTLEGEPEKLIMQAVKLDPRNVKALALAGTVAFNRNDFKKAVQYWEQAVAVAGPGSPYAQQLAGAVEEARQRAGMPAAAPAAAPSPTAPAAGSEANPLAAATSPASIRGRVTLRAALKDKVGPEDTVFIFARPATGSRMPLAILKKKVSDLPLEFTLDDSLAMSPASRLSNAQQVVVGARISRSGSAAPGPGDLEALSAPLGVNAQGLVLEIGEPVK